MSKHNAEQFGHLVRAAREKAGKSQGDLGRYLGVSTSYICEIERGRRTPFTYNNLVKAAHFLDADLSALVWSRAKWYGHVEVPLTGNIPTDSRALALAVSALKEKP